MSFMGLFGHLEDGVVPSSDVESFRAARDFLLANREDYQGAYDGFEWPALTEFNWARDWFDGVLAVEHADSPALWIVEEDGSEERLTFAELSSRSSQVAGWLRGHGVGRGDRVLLMLGNQVELWETILAAIKLGAVDHSGVDVTHYGRPRRPDRSRHVSHVIAPLD